MTDENGNAQSTGLEAPLTLSEIAQTLVAFIGIPAALLYPVGFIVFVLQIWMFYPFSFSTAWYASSLIPVAAVTGQGVKVLLVPLVTTSVISLLFGRTLIARYGERLRRPFFEENYAPRPRWISLFVDQLLVLGRQLSVVTLSVLTVLIVLFAALLVPLSIVVLTKAPELAGLIYWAFFTVAATPFVLIGGEFILYDYHRSSRPEDNELSQPPTPSVGWVSRGVRDRWIFRGLLVAYLGSVVSALFVVIPLDWLNQDPDLPHVELHLVNEPDKTVRQIEDGLLLSHSDGYWHVIDTSRMDHSASQETQNPSFIISSGKNTRNVKVFESPMVKADLDARIHLDDLVKADKGSWVNKHFTYTVEVTNAGPSKASKIFLENYLPEKMTFLKATQRGPDPSFHKELTDCAKLENAVADRNDKGCNLETDLGRYATASVEVEVASPDYKSPENEVSADGLYSFATDIRNAEVDPDATDRTKIRKSLKIDTFDPETTPTPDPRPNAHDWNNTKVTVSLDAEDTGGSGVKEIFYSASGAQNIPETPYDPQNKPVISAEGETTVTYSAKDVAGNTKVKSFSVKLDKTDPEIKLNTPGRGAKYTLKKTVTADYACTSGESGIDICDGSVSSGADIDTDPVGSRVFKVEAKDRAGNTSSKAYTYSIIYDFGGFLPPIKASPTLNVTQAGDAVLVKFSLAGDQGMNILADDPKRSSSIKCDTQDGINAIDHSDLQHTTGVDNYIFAWSTDESWSGTCRKLILRLEDGTQHAVNVKLAASGKPG